jgi:hypothetical protein
MQLETLSPLKSEAKELKILNVDGTESEMRVKAYSIDSDAYQKARKKLQQANAKRKEPMTDTEFSMEICKACVVGWNGVFMNETAIEFNAANLDWILNDFPFIRNQIAEFISQREFFLRT